MGNKLIHQHDISHEEVARVFNAVEHALAEVGTSKSAAVVALLALLGMIYAGKQLSSDEIQEFADTMTSFMLTYFTPTEVKH